LTKKEHKEQGGACLGKGAPYQEDQEETVLAKVEKKSGARRKSGRVEGDKQKRVAEPIYLRNGVVKPFIGQV